MREKKKNYQKKFAESSLTGATNSEKSLSSSIILATRNRLPDVLTFLDSVVQQTMPPNELIVVDSSDQKLINDSLFLNKFSKNLFSDTKLIYKYTKPGLTHQRNIGVSLASADIFYFFDDDTVLCPNYLENMNKIFMKHPNCAGGMGSTVGISKKRIGIHRILRNVFCLQRDHASGRFTISGMPTHAYGLSKFKKVEVLGGCCMAYRSWVFKKYIFDEKLSEYSYMEDCDFSRRVSYEFPLFFNPEAKLKHNHSPLDRDRVEDNRAMFIKNYTYLFFKNFYPRNKFKIIFYLWSVLGLFVQAIYIRDRAYIRGYVKGLKRYYFDC